MNGPTIVRFVAQAAIWGSSFALIKAALLDLAPNQLVLSRLILGAGVLAVVALVTRVSLRMKRRTWIHVTISAVFANVLPYMLLSYGERHTSAGLAGVLIGGTPLVTLVIAALAIREERVSSRGMVGFIAGFVGVVLVLSPWAAAGASVGGSIACFAAAVSYAGGYVYVRKFISTHGITPLALATNQLVAASMLQAIITPFFGWKPVTTAAFETIFAVLLLGVLSTGFANILYFRLIHDVGAATASAVDYLVPIFAVVFSVLIIGDAVTWNVVIGGIVVLLGMALAEGRLGAPASRR